MSKSMTPSDTVQQAWTRLVRAAAAVRGRVEADLKAADLPPLDWYDVLLELSREPAPLRQGELGERLLLERYNLSRRLDRMEAAGLIERRPRANDARTLDIALTKAGRALQARMWPVYAAALNRHVAAKLNETDTARLSRLLNKVLAP